MITPKYFWAKTTEDGQPGVSVLEHMLNVGNVAERLAELADVMLARFGLSSKTVGGLAAMHDIGKISPGFQLKCPAWLELNNLVKIATNGMWDSRMESDHGKISQQVIQAYLANLNINASTAAYVSAVLGAHHGRLNLPNLRWPQQIKMGSISENGSGIDWVSERVAAIDNIWRHFEINDQRLEITDSNPALWWLAGLTSVADWIGSDERFFSALNACSTSAHSKNALTAIESIGFKPLHVIRDLSFHDLFHESDKPEQTWEPNEMQIKAHSVITGPGVYVIEAPMGIGKTEAALWAAYQLFCQNKASGIYFALPTQATSNRIHQRLNNFIQKIAPEADFSRLIHANSWLMEQAEYFVPTATTGQPNVEDARTGRDWFSSAKRALLAPFGVGTIDQALLGVVAAKHFFVRHFALAGKVVVIDEVHSYDLYTGSLIDKLIATLEGLGCTVIILSATLTSKRRKQIVPVYEHQETDDVEGAYPLITGKIDGKSITPIAIAAQAGRKVQVSFLVTELAEQDALALATNGGCVLWVCNTVEAAQKQFERFDNITVKNFKLGLLHSRYPFWRREELEEEWMELLGKQGTTRCGSILVSTQIVEQSVDLDADLLISELAPTDMLLQRIGRLWRHERNRPENSTPRLIILSEAKTLSEFQSMTANEITKSLGKKAFVYDPFVLLRTLQEWQQFTDRHIDIPTQIRSVLESTYQERDDDPASWQKLFDDRFSTNSGKKFLANRNCNIWQAALEDEEGVQTRLNDQPTVSVILCKLFENNKMKLLDNTVIKISGDTFSLGIAQAVHKNIVKVPEHCFMVVKRSKSLEQYVRGSQCVGLISADGSVTVSGLKEDVRLHYSYLLGLVINKH